MVSICLLSFVS